MKSIFKFPLISIRIALRCLIPLYFVVSKEQGLLLAPSLEDVFDSGLKKKLQGNLEFERKEQKNK